MKALALMVALTTGCGGDDGAAPIDAPPAAIDGTWSLTRTVSTQGTPPCRTMSGSVDTLQVAIAADPQFTLPEHALFDPQIYDHAVTATSISFVAEEFGLFTTDPGRPVLLQHALHIDGAQLIGTALAQGDGDDLGCRWQLTVVGTRAP